MDAEDKSHNPKQAREQKLRRDKRRKDNRRQNDAPSNVEPDSAVCAPKGQREQNSRVRERRLAPVAEPKKLASEGAADEKTEPELPDFSNLKRETDEIVALTSKKYSKRQIFSNWTKYENPSEVHSEEEEDGRRPNFEDLAHLPASAGGHFKFKSEHSWDVNPSSLYSEFFSVNVESLTQGLACIPLYDKLQLQKDLLSGEELERIDYFAKQSSARYNVTKASLKEGTIAQDANNHINKILNILSYKENHTSRKTGPSMYENVDEDDQLENKSLVQFSFDMNPTEQGGTSVEVCVPTKSLSSRNSTPGKESEQMSQPYANPAEANDFSESSKVVTSDDQVNTTVTSFPLEPNLVGSANIKEEIQEISSTTGLQEIIPSKENHVTEVPHKNEPKSEEEKMATEEPVILEQRTGRGKKSSKGKNKKEDKKGKSEENNNIINKKATVVESTNVVSNSCASTVEKVVIAETVKTPVGRTVAQVVVEDKLNTNVKYSKDIEKPNTQEWVVEKESNKPVEQRSKKAKGDVKNNPKMDSELDFLLSLKKPVEEVKPKIAPPSQAAKSAIDDDEADSVLPLVTQRASEENLEDWLDSMLED